MGLKKDFVRVSFTVPSTIHLKTAHLCNVNCMLGVVEDDRSWDSSMQRKIHMK